MPTKLIPKEAEEFVGNTLQELQRITEVNITSKEDYIRANHILKQIKKKEKELLNIRLSITRPLDDSKAKIIDFFRPTQENLARVKNIYNNAMIKWHQEQENKRIAEEKRLQKKKKKEEEKKRQSLLKRAEKQREKGNIEKAEELKEKAEDIYIPSPVVISDEPKPKGTYIIKTWKYKVIDISKVDRKWLIPNDKMLTDFARATKGQVPIEGIEFYCIETIANRET